MYAYLLYPHVVNNCIKRHINIPTYSTSTENVYLDQYYQGSPMIQQPMMNYGYMTNQYQGNVGVEGINQPMQGMNPYMNFNYNPFNM